MLGAAIVRANEAAGRPVELLTPTRKDLDLTDRSAVATFIDEYGPDTVIHAAAKVGGIAANIADPVGFLTNNLALNLSVIQAAAAGRVGRFLNIGSSCMYPRDYRQPLVEGDILKASLEPTNEGYALSKIVATRHCTYLAQERQLEYRTIVPCNLYGPGDSYSVGHSHLIASIIAKLYEAKADGRSTVEIWGDGTARREFLYVDDLAGWIIERAAGEVGALPDILNVGAGKDHSVEDYYRMAANVIGYHGDFIFDMSKPVGMRQKLIDSSVASDHHGWTPTTTLANGIATAYAAYLQQGSNQ